MGKYKKIIDFFSKNLPHIKADKHLAKKLRTFRLGWSTKSDEYIDFLGSKLLGVHTIRFSSLDDNKLMEEVLGIENWKDLQKEIYEIEGMEKNFKVASDIIYQTLTYITHLFLKNGDKKLLNEGVRESCLIMQYRMICSLYSWYFKFNTTETIATSVYNKLSHKYLIKQHRNWQEVFEYRVTNCLDKHSPNYKKLVHYSTEDAIRLVSDIQTKLREQVKQMYKILISILENNEVIKSESSTYVGGEKEEEQIRDITATNINFINNIKKMIFNKNELINKDLIHVIDHIVPNINKELMQQFLTCVSEIEEKKEQEKIYEYIELIVLKNLEYLQRLNINIKKREYIPKAIVLIKNFWSSSKVKDPKMKEIKAYFQNLAFKCTGKKTSWLLVSLSIGIIAYIFLISLKQE